MARTTMARRAFEVVGEWDDLNDLLCSPAPIEDTLEGSFRLTVSGVDGQDRARFTRALAGRIDRPAVLREPDEVVKVLAGKPTYAGILRHTADRRGLLERDVTRRPHFSPVSIRSHYARLLVNLSRAPVGGRFADPFCGGGGILLEAADIGASALGIDISAEAVDGARTNLGHYGLAADLRVGDVSDLKDFSPVDAVATDPPYGRSTSTRDEGLAAIYGRMFSSVADSLREDGHFAVALPAEWALHVGDGHMERTATHPVRVHRSLTRHFAVYRTRDRD